MLNYRPTISNFNDLKSNFISNLYIYIYTHVIHDEIYIFAKRKEKKLNNL